MQNCWKQRICFLIYIDGFFLESFVSDAKLCLRENGQKSSVVAAAKNKCLFLSLQKNNRMDLFEKLKFKNIYYRQHLIEPALNISSPYILYT